MKIRSMLVALMLVALVAICISKVRANDAWNSHVATPTATAQGPSPEFGFGSTTGSYATVTASSTALTNLLASLPSNDFQYVLIKVLGSSKTVYLNNTATTTNGIAFTDAMAPMLLPLPVNPKDRAKMYVIGGAGGEVVKIHGFKVR